MANRVYFDMDGVLANFDSAYDRLIGARDLEGRVFWEEVAKHQNFFRDLPLMPRARELWALVPEGDRRILGGLPKSIDQSANQKREWLKANFKIDDNSIIFVRGKKYKQAYARAGYILVDDWHDNIRDWIGAGGIGVWYQNAAQAIEDLRNSLISYE